MESPAVLRFEPPEKLLDDSKEDILSFFFIKKGVKHYKKITFNDILYVEALADYVCIYTKQKRFTVHSTMKHILSRLPLRHFVRVHRSYIVNLNAIGEVEDNLISIADKLIPVSMTYRKELMERLNIV